MKREAQAERHFDTSDTAPDPATEPMTCLPPLSPTQLASFFGTISTAC
jgi:hypothetical protein